MMPFIPLVSSPSFDTQIDCIPEFQNNEQWLDLRLQVTEVYGGCFAYLRRKRLGMGYQC
jgi:hypothetical protein